ncbi:MULTISPECIES: LysR family transcriptional regulator [Acidiphilium]|jgi:DNA-binding transcriptional LysR family regulator|uniref:LysR family transcriptional regulator n=1 Tax=Acidiphilium TaxID=522 RepID=UPI001F4C219D|nr:MULTISPECIES: LysR family transcriptional regulator [Acidiphilium]MBU6357370.1 LysR family transcriptional regulator [Rhodospirillales bacterium]MDE2326771.1 LysR family transcriptional regulator [Rhodospirillales bacterium]UNC14363.1 LysR family transcriptional regulator [Acidiphilium multivorum]
MQVELRHWRAFVAAADAGHFGHAAERLGISQPALSQLIRAIETALGLSLFDRAGRNIRPSAAALGLLPEARAIVTQADRAERAGAAIARRQRRAIAAGYVGSAAFHPLFAALIRAIDTTRPEIALRIDQVSGTIQVQHLAATRLDLGIVRSPLPTLDPALATLTLARERMMIAVAETSTRRDAGPLPLAAFAEHPFIQYIEQPSGGLRRLTAEACAAAGFAPRTVQTVPQIATMLCLVGTGIGVAMVPETMARFVVPGVAYRPLRERIVTDLILIYRRSDTAPALRATLRLARRLVDKSSLSI